VYASLQFSFYERFEYNQDPQKVYDSGTVVAFASDLHPTRIASLTDAPLRRAIANLRPMYFAFDVDCLNFVFMYRRD
jgi:hypothetical protein